MEPGLSSRERLVFTGDLPATSGGQAEPIVDGGGMSTRFVTLSRGGVDSF
jgi:hypothetical protein